MYASLELVNRFKTLHVDKLVNSIGYKIIFYTGITKKSMRVCLQKPSKMTHCQRDSLKVETYKYNP